MKPCSGDMCVKITGRNVILLAVFDSSYPHEAQLPFLQIICEPTAQKNHQCQCNAALTIHTYQSFLFHSLSNVTNFTYQIMEYLQFLFTDELHYNRKEEVQKKK